MLTSHAREPVLPQRAATARPPARRAGEGSRCALAPSIGLPQHPDEHRPERPVLLAVNQELGEGAGRRFPCRRARHKSALASEPLPSRINEQREHHQPRDSSYVKPRFSATSASSSLRRADLRPTRRLAPTRRARPRTSGESRASTCSLCRHPCDCSPTCPRFLGASPRAPL